MVHKNKLSEYSKFVNNVALLADDRWVKRILHWNPGGGIFPMASSKTKFSAAGVTGATGLRWPTKPICQGQGQPCMPHWAACFNHRGKRNKRNLKSVFTHLGKLNAILISPHSIHLAKPVMSTPFMGPPQTNVGYRLAVGHC